MLAWVLSLMVLLQPRAPWLATFHDTAAAVADVVLVEQPLFEGAHGRERTAALLVSVAWFESTFRPDALGDHGQAHGLYQVHDHGELADAREATRTALALMRQSFRACRALPMEERLAWYAAGGADGCTSEAGRRASRHRVSLGMRLFAKHPPP